MRENLFDENIERAVLSSIIFEGESRERVFASSLRSDDFFIPFHRRLFDTLLQLRETGFDEALIARHMKEDFDEIRMVEVLAAVPLANVDAYIETLKDLARRRRLRQMALEVIERIERGESDGIVGRVHDILESVERDSEALLRIVPVERIEPEEAEFVCKEWLPFPRNAVSLVTAGGGVGKSFLLLQAAMRMVRDEGLRVFLWLSEDPLSLSRYRFETIAREILQSDVRLFAGKLHLAGSDSETIHFLEESREGVRVSDAFHAFKAALRSYDVIVLDPLIAMFGADENNNAHARRFINLFTRWATTEGKTVIFIHHGTKNSSQSRGASAFVDAVRLVYRVEHIKGEEGAIIEDDSRWIILDKDNNGAKKYLGEIKVKRRIFPKKRRGIEIEYI